MITGKLDLSPHDFPFVTVYFGKQIGLNISLTDGNTIYVTCPPVSSEQDVDLTIKLYDKILHYNRLKFYYFNYLYNLQIEPNLGPTTGSTMITIYNEYVFYQNVYYYCLLTTPTGEIVLTAFLTSPYSVRCMTYFNIPEVKKFELNFDSVYTSQTPLEFTFYSNIRVRTSSLAIASLSSPCSLTITGENFIQNPYFNAKIGLNGDIIKNSDITFLAPDTVSFKLPEFDLADNYTIYVTNNNQNYEYFEYDKLLVFNKTDLVITEFKPDKKPYNNWESLIVDVIVAGFPEERYPVYFEINNQDYLSQYIDISTRRITLGVTPFSTSPVEYGVSFYFDKCEYIYSKKTFIFYPNLVINDFKPKIAEIYRSQNITVNADNVFNYDSFVCRYTNSGEQAIVNAVYINDNMFSCNVPGYLKIGTYDFSFSSNGYDFVQHSIYTTIEVVGNVKIYSITPRIIHNSYPDKLVIHGSGFINTGSINCLYEIEYNMLIQSAYYSSNKNNIATIKEFIVAGDYITDKQVLCLKPVELNNYSDLTLKVRIRLTDDNLFSKDFARLFIYQDLPNGYTIDSNNNVTGCPKGSICNKQLISGNVVPFTCSPGYYQDRGSSKLCKKCPPGHYCLTDSITPTPCSKGTECPYTKNTGEVKDCTSGLYCENIVTSNDYILTGYYNVISDRKICDNYAFCRGGLTTGVIIPSDNTSPSTCIDGHICTKGSTSVFGNGPCPSGHYCPNKKDVGILCPSKYYCPGRGNVMPLICPIGSYNDEVGQVSCKPCPLGYICPTEGMFKPEPCPNGYICDELGLSYPYNYCKPGYVCLDNIKLDVENPVCQLRDGVNPCDTLMGTYNTYFLKSLSVNVYQSLGYKPNFHDRLCCLSSKNITVFFEEKIDNYIASRISSLNFEYYNNDYSMSKFNDKILNLGLDGYSFYTAYVAKDLATLYQKLEIKINYLTDILDFIFTTMFNINTKRHYQYLCPRKYFCLEGCATFNVSNVFDYTPQLCHDGYYCQDGAKYITGSGTCKTGFYCPEGTSDPSITSSITDDKGLPDIITGCYTGSFSTGQYADECIKCPDGYECTKQGVSWPTVCKEGYYRTIFTSCTPCPKGSFSFEKGSRDSSQCQPCPEGTQCTSTKIDQPSFIKKCDDGWVCPEGTGLNPALQCPNGYFCYSGTKVNNMYRNPCPAGYICPSGTSETNKWQIKCHSDSYCPSGSKDTKQRLTKCPKGTQSSTLQGAMELDQCNPTSNYTLFSEVYVASANSVSVATPSTNANRIVNNDLRFLQESLDIQINSFNITKAEEAISYQSAVNLETDELVHIEIDKIFNKEKILSQGINLNRTNVLSISPIINDLNDIMTIGKNIKLPINNLSENLNYIFLSNNTYIVIMFDFRHIYFPENRFIYGLDWDITLDKSKDLSEWTNIPLPDIFVNKTNDKAKLNEFMLYTLEDIYLRVLVNFYNGLYLSYYVMFQNTTVIKIVKPDRAELGTNQIFGIILNSQSPVMLPVNIPPIDPLSDGDYESKVVKNFISYSSNDLSIKNTIAVGVNYFQPLSLYWKDIDMMGIPYLPYFSNCKGYGRYIPLYALLEQHSSCNLIPENETEYITDFSFGKIPVGDNCEINIDCRYDEDISAGSNSPFWFQNPAGTTLFSITRDPIPIEYIYDNFDTSELINVVIVEDVPPFTVPRKVKLEILYFQKSKALKNIVEVNVYYSDPLPQTEITGNIFYTLNVDFKALDHTKLMVKFALNQTFYLVLYIIIGFIALILVILFFVFHWLFNRNKKPKFRFFTYVPMTLPPAITGFILASIPIWMVVTLISLVMTGKLYSMHIIPCTDISQCYQSIFDYVSYQPDTNMQITSIRSGRLGTALIFFGFYLIIRSTFLFMPKAQTYHKLSYDYNIWDYFNWKGFNILYWAAIMIFIFIYFAMISFNAVWGNNYWLFIYTFKIIGILFENILEKSLNDQVLLSLIAATFNIVQNMITFGANSLVDFLIQYFIELSSRMIERVYLEHFISYIKENFDTWYQKIANYFKELGKLDLEAIRREEEEDEFFTDSSDNESYDIEEIEEEELDSENELEEDRLSEKGDEVLQLNENQHNNNDENEKDNVGLEKPTINNLISDIDVIEEVKEHHEVSPVKGRNTSGKTNKIIDEMDELGESEFKLEDNGDENSVENENKSKSSSSSFSSAEVVKKNPVLTANKNNPLNNNVDKRFSLIPPSNSMIPNLNKRNSFLIPNSNSMISSNKNTMIPAGKRGSMIAINNNLNILPNNPSIPASRKSSFNFGTGTRKLSFNSSNNINTGTFNNLAPLNPLKKRTSKKIKTHVEKTHQRKTSLFQKLKDFKTISQGGSVQDNNTFINKGMKKSITLHSNARKNSFNAAMTKQLSIAVKKDPLPKPVSSDSSSSYSESLSSEVNQQVAISPEVNNDFNKFEESPSEKKELKQRASRFYRVKTIRVVKNKITDIEGLIERYKTYAADMLTYFFDATFYIILWIFYDQTLIISNYGITNNQFIYFYYFLVVIIPFNIVIDIIFHNILEHYDRKLEMHDFLDYITWRFKVRKTSWILNDDKSNTALPADFRNLFKLSYSSQYFFISTFYVFGIALTSVGTLTIILNQINVFGDLASIPIFFFVIGVCVLIDTVSIKLGKILHIWHVPSEADEEVNYNPKPKFYKPLNIENWEKIKYLKEQEEILEEKLRTDRMLLETTRNKFLNGNKKFLQGALSEILTPKVLKENRNMIMKILKKKIDVHKIPEFSFQKYDGDEEESFKVNAESYRKKLDGHIGVIIKAWKKRAKLSIQLHEQVKVLISRSKKRMCESCGAKYFLRAVNFSSILDLFKKFLLLKGYSYDDYDFNEFKIFFVEKANIKTLCSNCS
jgi:hypothetical protein